MPASFDDTGSSTASSIWRICSCFSARGDGCCCGCGCDVSAGAGNVDEACGATCTRDREGIDREEWRGRWFGRGLGGDSKESMLELPLAQLP